MDLERVRAEWDGQAAAFDDEADHGLHDPLVRAAWWAALDPLLPAPPARVVDLGCGTGTISVLLADHGYDVTGIDLSPRMVAVARAKAQAGGHDLRIDVGDATEPDVEAGSFDVVVARHVVWALPDPAAAVRRWANLVRPGGRFVLVEGRWATGAGLDADALRRLVAPVARRIDVFPLDDPTLWGKEIHDERYALVAAL